MHVKVNVKPLSVNECWQGRRFKTPAYKEYERSVLLMLPWQQLPAPPFQIELTFGFSNLASDWDNPVKPFVDILQKKYKFNDKDIMKAIVVKQKVSKGEEFIGFSIKPLNQ